MNLNKYYCIVTGATSGIGREFAVYFAKKSYSLILTGRREKELNALKEKLSLDYSVEVITVLGDFVHKEVVEELIAISKNKNIKYLINNVGYGNDKTFFNQSIEEALKMTEVHINSTIRICHELLPLMKEDSYVINISSLAAFLPTGYNHIYSATKSFLIGFSESLSFSMAEKKIKVKVVLPGFVKSDFHRYTEVKRTSRLLWMDSVKLIELIFKEIDKGNILIVPGWVNKVVYFLISIMPKKALYYFLRKEKEL